MQENEILKKICLMLEKKISFVIIKLRREREKRGDIKHVHKNYIK